MATRSPVLAVLNRKGGVGKTTVAVNLAGALAEWWPVTLVDADPQGSSLAWLRPGAVHGLTVVAAPEPEDLARVLDTTTTLTVVDGPPFDVELNRVAFVRATAVVVPVVPSPLDINAARPVLEACMHARKRAVAVLSLVDGRTVHARAMAREVLARTGVPVAAAELARRQAHVDAVAAREPVITYAPTSPAADEVRALVAELLPLLT